MVHVDSQSGTVTLNAAVVPRVKSSPASAGDGSSRDSRLRHFLLVHLKNGLVERAANTWVEVSMNEAGTWSCSIAEVEELLKVEHGQVGKMVHCYDAFNKQWIATYLSNDVATLGQGLKCLRPAVM